MRGQQRPDLFGYTPGWWADQIEHEMRQHMRRVAWARRLRAAGTCMLSAGVILALAGIPWPEVVHWPLTIALAGGSLAVVAGELLDRGS